MFGDIAPWGLGSFAEYAVVPEDALAYKPANLSFEQAAAVPVAGLTALQGLDDQGQIQPGQKVLIQGAAGWDRGCRSPAASRWASYPRKPTKKTWSFSQSFWKRAKSYP